MEPDIGGSSAPNVRYSDVPNDFSSYQCHICGFMGAYRPLLGHIFRKHKLTTSVYKANYGNITCVEKVLHICKICQREISFVRDFLANHLLQHALKVDEYFTKYCASVSLKPKIIRYNRLANDYSTYWCHIWDGNF